jgi:hypothetical protein
MRTTTSLGRLVPSQTQTKGSEHLGWHYYPSSIYIYKSKIEANLEKENFDIFFFLKFLKHEINMQVEKNENEMHLN